MCLCHRLTNVDHGGVPLLSLLVEPEEAVVVEPKFPSQPPSFLLFLLSLPLLGGRGGTEGCGFGVDDTRLE
jgi:hypothetical protein